MSGSARRWIAVLIVLPALLWLVTVVWRERAAAAPMTLVASSPAARDVLTTAPAEVELTWSAPADATLSHVAVEDGGGRTVRTGPPRTGPDNVLHVPIAEDAWDAEGFYTLGYHVVGADGGEATGSLRFSVGAGPVPAGAPPSVKVPHAHSIDPASAVLLLVNLAVVVGAGVLLLRRPRPRRPAPSQPGDADRP